MTPPQTILSQRRRKLLERRRNLKMAGSAQAFVRGTTQHFYNWIESRERNELPDGPWLWICGDCHYGNLGPVADLGGRVGIEIRDFDQAVIGNPVYDLIRLGLSLSVEARASDLPGVTTAGMLEAMMIGYLRALEDEPDRLEQPTSVRRVLRRARGRKWKQLAEDRIDDPRPTIPIGNRFWRPSAAEKHAIEAIFHRTEAQALVIAIGGRSQEDVEVLDAAFWVKGCSSLGRLRYALIVGVGGKHPPNRKLALIDIKEAVEAICPCAADADLPAEPAVRVVEGAQALSPALGNRMAPAEVLGHSVFVRELMPQDLKLELSGMGSKEAAELGAYLACIVGQAHGRQLAGDDRAAWAREIRRQSAKSAAGPNWLWKSVVDLIALHERAYLEHCRKFSAQLGT